MLALKTKVSYAFLFGIFFSLLYSIAARLPRYTELHFATSLDAATPFIPFFILFYLLSYLFPLAAFIAATNQQELKIIFKTFLLQLLLAIVLFLAIPVAIQHPPVLSTDIFSRILGFIRSIIDNQWNAFPSHHVATAFLTFLIVQEKNRKYTIPAFILAFLIILSTLFTKQHVIIDVLAGLVLATTFYFYYESQARKINKERNNLPQ